jgi:hypothetical protein
MVLNHGLNGWRGFFLDWGEETGIMPVKAHRCRVAMTCGSNPEGIATLHHGFETRINGISRVSRIYFDGRISGLKLFINNYLEAKVPLWRGRRGRIGGLEF